ncbi:hypothetical protein N9K20_04520 [Methylophilaceae bacterium]|nr:hypothetical protein [Methylophilaceae bacterium]
MKHGANITASNVFIDKAYANQIQKVVICNEDGFLCASTNGYQGMYGLITYPSKPRDYFPKN